jgi:hypothetical protein
MLHRWRKEFQANVASVFDDIYVYPGKANNIMPNALRGPQTPAEMEVIVSDIFEVHLADVKR